MRHITSVNGSCGNRPRGIEANAGKNKGALAAACAGVRSIIGSDGAVRRAQKAVSYITRVNVASRDRPHRIDVAGKGTLAGGCARTLNVEGSDHAVRSAQETVKHIVRVRVVTRGCACRVDAEG